MPFARRSVINAEFDLTRIMKKMSDLYLKISAVVATCHFPLLMKSFPFTYALLMSIIHRFTTRIPWGSADTVLWKTGELIILGQGPL